ncbi:MAG: hypothetical protein ACRC37_06725 [Lentisphaeria bacterium]
MIIFNPLRFGDERALQTQWTVMKSGGANYCTHKLLIEDGGPVARFKSTNSNKIVTLLMLLLPLLSILSFFLK